MPAGQGTVERAISALTTEQLAILLEPGRDYTLLVLAHPHCPCTRATLHELQRLVPHIEGRVALKAYFVIPEGESTAFAEGENLRLARTMPSLSVSLAPEKEILPLLGAGTSGQVLVFQNQERRLDFAGGITAGRGHEGSNPGSDSILTLVRTGRTSLTSTPVFGCALGGGAAPGTDTRAAL